MRRILFVACSFRSRTRSLNARQHIRKRIEGPSLPTAFSHVCFSEGGERYIKSSHSGSAGSHDSNGPSVSILVDYESTENTNDLRQAGLELVILNDAQSSEGLAVDKKVEISTSQER